MPNQYDSPIFFVKIEIKNIIEMGMNMVKQTNRITRQDVPTEQTWNVADLFSSKASWEEALNHVQNDVKQITEFKGHLGKNSSTLLNALEKFDDFTARLVRLGTYANLRISSDGTNTDYQADMITFASIHAKINAQLTFFETEILMIPKETLEKFHEEEPALNTFKKMLDEIQTKKPFTLSDEVESMLATLAEVLGAPYTTYSRSKASDLTFSPITDKTGNQLPVSEALYEDRYEMDADTNIRRKAYDSFTNSLSQYKHTYASIYATEVTKQVTMAKVRGYDSVTDMLLHPQQVSREMYDNQLTIIQEELAPHMQRFAKLKQKDYQLREMRFSDLKISLDPNFNPETTFSEAKSMILDALSILGPEYHHIMEKAFNNRWIDYADNIGKQSGAFCSSPYGSHPFILMTWTNMMRGAFTLAHELGHAGHFYLANKYQTFTNTRPSTYFVEAPSTLNELLLANHLIEQTNDSRMKRWVISQLLGTYYHNFVTHLLEGEFQRRVYTLAELGTPLTANVLCQQKLETIRNFWGETVVVDESAGLTWMRQPHYYMGLYPYTYSAGLTVATVVAERIKQEGQLAIDDWIKVLKAGGTLKPLQLAKKAGVDMSNPTTIKKAVDYVGSLIDILETDG